MPSRATAVLVALVVFGACRPASPPPPQPLVPAPIGTRAFLVREAQLEGGPVSVHLEIPLAPAGPKPAVISLLGDSRPLLAAGFVVATYQIHWAFLPGALPPAPPEGTGVGKWVLAAPTAATLGEGYLRQIAATATEHVPQVLDYLVTVPEVDAQRIGMVGGSTNGFIALQATAADRRIGAVVAIAACGDYHRFLQFSSMGMEGRPLALDSTYDAWIRTQELIHHPQQLVHAAAMMLNRTEDPLIPIACADETARVLTAAYARAGVPQRFRFVRLEGQGHGISPPEANDAFAWLDRWLLP